ncbi:MAG: hypothetical protein HY460_01115 [Parcubacteria group bacterium]|nr:hypothetical protein [Parcubacteria group bacterium]
MTISEDTKRWLVSSIVTFLATFLVALGTNIGNLGTEAVTSSALAGIVLLAVRAGIKAVTEALLRR